MRKWGIVLALVLCLLASGALAEGTLTLPAGLKVIKAQAFAGSPATEVVLPEGVQAIGSRAFEGSAVTRINLPASITQIDEDAFASASNDLIATVASGSYAHIRCQEIGIRVHLIGEAMSDYLYEMRTDNDGKRYAVITGYDGPTDAGLNIPAEIDGLPVWEIAEEAFCGREELTGSLTISGGVRSIGNVAFADCSGLTGELTIPSSVTSIGEGAFFGCSGLTGTLTISEGVTEIGGLAFAFCSSVETAVLPRTLTRIGDSAFDSIVNLVARVWKGSYAQQYCEGNGITVELINEVMSDDLYKTKIDDDGTPYAAITGYEGPTDAGLNIPAEIDGLPVRAIEDAAFAGRGDLTGALTIPVGMKRIGESAFMGCSGLTGDLTIPEGMETIGALAFVDCSGLTGTLTIPASATGIDDFAFIGCRFSEVIDPTGNCPRTSEEGYYWRPLGKDANRHGVILQYAGPAVSDLTIPAQIDDVPLRVIESNAFRGQRGLTGTLTIPESVTRIGNQAFFGCTGIERIVLPESLGSIGAGAFDGMSSNLVAVVKEGGRMHEYCVANGIRVEFAPEL